MKKELAFWKIELQMDHMTHNYHGQVPDPHAGHKMSDIHGSHDRHAGHSVAMFCDKFWLTFALTIPVVFWSTLTRGTAAVSGVAAAPGTTEDDLIARAAAVESNSEHPLAKAIVAAAGRRSLTRLAVTNFEALPGRGAKALVEGTSVEIGGPRLVTEARVTVPPE